MDNSYLQVSDGNGDAALMHVEADRSPGSSTLNVDAITNVPAKFIATTGKLGSDGFITADSKQEFYGHVSGSDLQIEGFLPDGATDEGNDEGDVVIIRPNTTWANMVAAAIATPVISVPTGAVLPYAGDTAPDDFLICDGSTVSRTDYAALFAVVGETFGAGDGSTTFALPDLSGRVPAGVDSGDSDFGTLGHTGGEKTHVLTTTEMPSHNHSVDPPSTSTSSDSHSHTLEVVYSSNGSTNHTSSESAYHDVSWGTRTTSSDSHSHTVNIAAFNSASTGGGGAHNNLQPFIALNYIIRT